MGVNFSEYYTDISAMDMELSEEARTLRSKFKEEGRLTVITILYFLN